MDKSSINSLNSKRNFKLPPIQGALPASLYGERTWTTNKPITVHHQPHARIKKKPIPSQNLRTLNRAALQTSVQHFTPKKAAPVPSPRQHTTELDLGHEFPKSYSVLPPISKASQIQHNGNSSLLSATRINPIKRETRRRTVDNTSTASELLSERRRERLLEKHKAQKADSSQGSVQISQSIEKEIESLPTPKPSKTEETKESVNRKQSATFLLYLKSKRNYRRGGVCPENESSLINVTEQLKEIFLRRNMEEMYLI